ncbi:MAG: FAD-binding oxidoreductase, partial [Bacteroidota bacterium]
AALAECRELGLRITVSGAGTGLAGGRVPVGGAVIATSQMKKIVSIDPQHLRAVVEPGVILGEFQAEVEQHGVFYPPDPTERTCFIGGTVATNSSGARTFKYGPTRNFIESLDIVLADGDRLKIRRGEHHAQKHQHGNVLRLVTERGREIDLTLPEYTMPRTKHAAGYFINPGMDAIDLFIGAEGTLGIVTRIEVRLLPLPEKLFSGIIFFPDERATLDFVEEARDRSREQGKHRGDGVEIEARALEYIDANSLELIRDEFPTIPEDAAGGAIWMEQETTEETDEALLELWYELMLKHNALVDASWFAIGEEDQRRMRHFRHAVPEAVYEQITEGAQTKLGTDMAVPDSHFRELLAFYRDQFQMHDLRNVIYGHIGNSHLHANIFARGDKEFRTAKEVYNRLVDKALSLGGTISAEHGVGKLKRSYLATMYGAEAIEGMRRLKLQLDPAGILGTGTMFDI